MSKFRLYLQNSKNKYVLFGFIFEIKVDPIECLPDTHTRTTVAFIPPSRFKEGINPRLWGYNKTKPLAPKPESEGVK